MDLLLILTYAAICVVIFKVFKIPLNKWSVPTAILGGIFLIGSLIFLMNYNHPYSEISREYFVTTPIVPAVTGTVIEVPVKPNVLLTKDDILFLIAEYYWDSKKVASLDAQLTSAIEDLKRAKSLRKKGVGTQRDVDLATAQVDNLTHNLMVRNMTSNKPQFAHPLMVMLLKWY